MENYNPKIIKKEVNRHKPFNHNLDSVMSACDINYNKIDSEYTRIGNMAINDKLSNSKVIELIENNFTKRELAYMFVTVDVRYMQLKTQVILEKQQSHSKQVINPEMLKSYI